MANIELSGYKNIVRNKVFGKEAKPFQDPLIGKVTATQLVWLTKFKVPTQNEIIEFIIKSTKEIDISSLEKKNPFEDDSKINYYLKLLSEFSSSKFKSIARGDKDTLHNLITPYPNRKLHEGRTYIMAYNGIVPNEILDAVKAEMEKEVYKRAIWENGVKKWNLKVRLLENEEFPKRLELEYLVDMGVRDSDVFSAYGDFGDYQTVANQVRLFYHALSSPELIAQVCDTSYQFLEGRATSIIRKTTESILTKEAIDGLVRMINQSRGLFGSLLDEPTEEHDGNNEFSNN